MPNDTRFAQCRARWPWPLLALSLALSCATEAPPPEAPPPPPPAPTIPPPKPPAKSVQLAVLDAVAAEDRSEEDVALDQGRQPQRLFTFLGVAPGMRVAELGAGGGYSAEILARIVGPEGKVYGQNSKFMLERFAEVPWSKRLLEPVMSNVVRVDREFDDPLPPDVKDLDMVTMILFYHDTVWMGTDRDKMNRAIFAALKSGGVYGIVDHSAREGAGVADAQTLHRIEESVVRAEVEKAGFLLQESADFLRNPDDTRDWNASPSGAGEKRGTSDRFVLEIRQAVALTEP